MENLVGRCGEFAGGGEDKMCGNEEVRQVIIGEVASDRLMVAGGASVFEDGLVITWVDPDRFETGDA
jgi:hypothetical protein